jgi:hypothetical protein
MHKPKAAYIEIKSRLYPISFNTVYLEPAIGEPLLLGAIADVIELGPVDLDGIDPTAASQPANAGGWLSRT